MKLLSISFFLIILTVNSVDPLPLPLPQKFTQSFTVSEQQGEMCSGKVFYDSTTLSQKVSLIGGKADYYCGDGSGNSCSAMLINGTGYLIFPEIKQCCHIDLQYQLVPRDILVQNFTFQRETVVNDKKCYFWSTIPDSVQLGVYTDLTQKRVMIRFLVDVMSHVSVVDFWDGSYSQKFSEKTVFQVPTYCSKECSFDSSNSRIWKMALGMMQRAEQNRNRMQNLVAEE